MCVYTDCDLSEAKEKLKRSMKSKFSIWVKQVGCIHRYKQVHPKVAPKQNTSGPPPKLPGPSGYLFAEGSFKPLAKFKCVYCGKEKYIPEGALKHLKRPLKP